MDVDKKRMLDELGFTWRVRVVRGSKRRTRSLRDSDDDDDEEEVDDAEEDGEEEDEDDDDLDESVEDTQPKPVRHYGGRETLLSPTGYNYNRNLCSGRSPQAKASPGSSDFQCSACLGDIIYASAQCESCREVFCQACFDELRLSNAQQCKSCAGPVAAMTSGWAI